MSFSRLALLFLVGCNVENEISNGPKDPGFDDGDPVVVPGDTDTDTTPPVDEELCNGLDDDGDGEIDEGYADADGNGRVDCLDVECPGLDLGSEGEVAIVEACAGSGPTEVTDPWDATIEYQYTSSGSGVIVMPAVGNLTDDNGDGLVDENDTPDIAFTVWGSDTLVALHGDGSGVIFEAAGYRGAGGVTIADVDSDGTPEIIAYTTQNRVAAVTAGGWPLWQSGIFYMSNTYPQPVVCDLDGDGTVEAIVDAAVVNGEDGSTVTQLGSDSTAFRTPVCADLDQDGASEIILGNAVYDGGGAVLWRNAGMGAGNFAAVVDVDGDVGGETFFVSDGRAYLHDEDGTALLDFEVPGGGNPGPPCAADFDGDGAVELAVPSGAQISVFDTDGTRLWSATMQDNSGLAGCSGYDVDGDGAYEVLFADEIAFRIYDGATGAVHYENRNHTSGTVWEYPVVADVDNDGSAEIVVADNFGAWKGITVFGHSGDGWPKSGPTWGTHDFAVTNLDADGHVPTAPEPSWLAYNVFRARPAVDDPSSPDLVASILDVCVADCDYGPVALSVQVLNQGGDHVDAGAVLAVYADDGGALRLVASQVLPRVDAGTKILGVTFSLSPADIGSNGFVAVVDDGGAVRECDETNNSDAWTDVSCPE